MKTIRLKFLMLMLVLGTIFPISSKAETYPDFSYNGLYYFILSEVDRTVEVTYKSFFENENYVKGIVFIPQNVTYKSKSYTVKEIGYHAFSGCSGITNVQIPGYVTRIGDDAFSRCTNLYSVSIPNSVTEIGEDAFDFCIRLNNIEIPNSVTTIGARAFSKCIALTSVDIPRSVSKIEDNPFTGCDNLQKINVQQTNPIYTSKDGILYSKNVTSLIACPAGKKGIIKIPATVTTIEISAFSGCKEITKVDIPNSVTSIGRSAFEECKGLSSVDIPNSVTSIGDYPFSQCYNLSMINVQQDNPVYASVDGILYSKKNGIVTSLKECPPGKKGIIKIPDSVTDIEESAFSGCNGITSVDIPSSVTTIGYSAFSGIDDAAKIYCHWEKPIESTHQIFNNYCLRNAILYVPIGTMVNYEKVDPWRNFWNIEEIDYNTTTGIKDVVDPDKSTLYEIDRFDVNGKPVSRDYKGLVIIRYSDGSIKKQIVK